MFNSLDTVVDAVQTAKKQFVTTFVTDKSYADAANKFVDAQTAYTKAAVKAGTEFATTFAALAQKSATEVGSKTKEAFAKFKV